MATISIGTDISMAIWPRHGHLSFLTECQVRCITVPELGSAIGLWGAMCIAAHTAEGGLLLSDVFATDHTSPFAILGAAFGSTPHHTRRVCACVSVCVSVRVIPHTLEIDHRKAGKARRYRDVKGSLKRAKGRSKPAYPAKRFVRFTTSWPCAKCV